MVYPNVLILTNYICNGIFYFQIRSQIWGARVTISINEWGRAGDNSTHNGHLGFRGRPHFLTEFWQEAFIPYHMGLVIELVDNSS